MILGAITVIGLIVMTLSHVFLRNQYKRTDLDYSDDIFDENKIYNDEL
jgi:hypothetical protein